MNLDGSNSKVLAHLADEAGDNPLFGLTLNSGSMYVSMWGSRGVWEVQSSGNTVGMTQVWPGTGEEVLFSMASADIWTQPYSKCRYHTKHWQFLPYTP